MRSNERYCYGSFVIDQLPAGPGTSVCTLVGCDVAVQQPPGGGRRRLYCSDAHRAEARRRRLADFPGAATDDLVGSVLRRLAVVLDDLRAYEATLRSVDPELQAAEMARVRAEATAGVLAAQQLGARAAEDAARTSQLLAAERSAWGIERGDHAAQIEELSAATGAARAQAASAQEALEEALGAHRAELDERDRLGAAAAARHEEEVARLSGELDAARTALAAGSARADAADHRAATAEDALRAAVAHAAETDALLSHLRAEVGGARAVAAGAEERARRAEVLLDRAQVELGSERDRHDASLSELRDQLAQLLARRPVVRAAKRRPAGKGSAPATESETGS